MTDEEMDEFTAAVSALTERMGPIMHRQPGAYVAGALAVMLGDLLSQQPPEQWQEALEVVVTRALNIADRLLRERGTIQ